MSDAFALPQEAPAMGCTVPPQDENGCDKTIHTEPAALPAGDVEAQQTDVEVTPAGGTTCCEVFGMVVFFIVSIYLWFGLFVVLPVCMPKSECAKDRWSTRGQTELPDCGLCDFFYEAMHFPFIFTMIFSFFVYVVCCCIIAPFGGSLPVQQWVADCATWKGAAPRVQFFIECYHHETRHVRSGGKTTTRSVRVVTHAADEDWVCTSSVDESTLPTLDSKKTYRVTTEVKVVMADQATEAHFNAAKEDFFRKNTRDVYQSKWVSNTIAGMPSSVLVVGEGALPCLDSRCAYIVLVLLLLAAPYTLYFLCATTRAEVVFIKRVTHAPPQPVVFNAGTWPTQQVVVGCPLSAVPMVQPLQYQPPNINAGNVL